jgi:hypothetical protein
LASYGDFPQDQLNILGDINALTVIQTVHPFYPDLTTEQLASAIDVGTIGDTSFYDIPENSFSCRTSPATTWSM